MIETGNRRIKIIAFPRMRHCLVEFVKALLLFLGPILAGKLIAIMSGRHLAFDVIYLMALLVSLWFFLSILIDIIVARRSVEKFFKILYQSSPMLPQSFPDVGNSFEWKIERFEP